MFAAAEKLFSEKGYSETTTREIAEAAGVNEVTIFRHFGTKEELFLEFLKKFSPIANLNDELERQLTGELGHDLKLVIRKHLEVAMRKKPYIRIAMMESPKNPELKRLGFEIPKRLTEHLTKYLNGMSEKGAIPEADYSFISHLVYSVFFQYILKECGFLTPFENFPEDMDEFTEKAVEFFVRGIKSKG